MLSVVVDDHDMGITHVIRGDDHLTNTFRQIQIYKACGWDIPHFGHIPLIYGSDGAKLSKRHGAASAEDYRSLGYLPEAISNYLLRLGWSHGDDEIISRKQAIKWFSFDNVGKSPSRFDMAKLQNLNAHYMRQRNNQSLLEYLLPFLGKLPDEEQKSHILQGMDSLKERAKTVIELADAVMVYVSAPDTFEERCLKYATTQHLDLLEKVRSIIDAMPQLEETTLCERVKTLAKDEGVKLVEIAQAIRAALCGKLVSPSVFEIIAILGKEESLRRIDRFISKTWEE
jgi:glutamyl-tRNA synthetase